MKKYLSILLLFSVTPSVLFAQESSLGNWMIYFGNVKIDSDWNWHNEVQYRNYDMAGDLEQLLLRTGLGYNLSENNNNLLLGYGYILSENYLQGSGEKAQVKEHRIFQQFVTRQKFGRFNILHRYRFEQRFVEDDFKLRGRYFLLLNIPVNQPELGPGVFYAAVYNELFVSLESPVFDRNRLYGGFGYQFNKTFKAEVGYMNQFFEKTSRDQINLIVFVNL
jgi:hypothetical protein